MQHAVGGSVRAVVCCTALAPSPTATCRSPAAPMEMCCVLLGALCIHCAQRHFPAVAVQGRGVSLDRNTMTPPTIKGMSLAPLPDAEALGETSAAQGPDRRQPQGRGKPLGRITMPGSLAPPSGPQVVGKLQQVAEPPQLVATGHSLTRGRPPALKTPDPASEQLELELEPSNLMLYREINAEDSLW